MTVDAAPLAKLPTRSGLTIAVRLATEADEAALERGFVSELLPLLTMLVGGYLAARAEVLAVSDGDLATEFLLLLEMENPAG